MLVCLVRALILYPFLILVIRLMGKRQLGEMEASEFVVTMLIADLASVPMQDLGTPLLYGLIPIITVLLLELILSSLSFQSVAIRKLICGKPVILMENGQIIQRNLRRTRLTTDELVEHLRDKNIVDLSTVKYAILETSGQINALLKEENQPLTLKDMEKPATPYSLPVTIISNGKLMMDNLNLSGKTMTWVNQYLSEKGCQVEQVVLLTVDQHGKTYLSLWEDFS